MEVIKNTGSLEKLLAEHPFLEHLSVQHLQFIAECASEASFEGGAHILREGEQADHLYLICQGTVALGTFVAGRGLITIETLDDGNILGWSWLIPPHHWHFSALTITPTRVIVIDGSHLRQKSEADHDFGYEILKRVAFVVGKRLRVTRLRLEV